MASSRGIVTQSIRPKTLGDYDRHLYFTSVPLVGKDMVHSQIGTSGTYPGEMGTRGSYYPGRSVIISGHQDFSEAKELYGGTPVDDSNLPEV